MTAPAGAAAFHARYDRHPGDRVRLFAVAERLAGYLAPKRRFPPTVDELRRRRRGIAYTRSPYAYLFRRTGGRSAGLVAGG